jgi:hypothetical protein
MEKQGAMVGHLMVQCRVSQVMLTILQRAEPTY